jgi:phenylacetate-CoA ligase
LIKFHNIYAKSPILLQNIACSIIGYKIKLTRYNKLFYRYLDFFKSTDTWNDDKLHSLEEDYLKEILKHACANVPYYHDLLQKLEHRFQNENIFDLLKEFPVIDKFILRDNWQSFQAVTNFGKKRIYGHTGGTTGTALKVSSNPSTQNIQWAIWWRQRARVSISPGEPYINFAGRDVVPLLDLELPIWRSNLGMRQTYVSVHHLLDRNLGALVKYLNSRKVKYYSGYPAALDIIAKFMLKNSLRLSNPPEYIFTGAETLTDYQRNNISSAFNTKVIDQYGATENCCNISECEFGNYHIDREFGFVELFPVKGMDEKYREIVATGFHNFSMPFIRYRTGDIVELFDKPCECGRAGNAIRRIDGRIEGVIKTPDGRNISRLDFLFKKNSSIKEAQLIQKEIDIVEINIVLEIGDKLFCCEELMEIAKKYLGKSIAININIVSSIDRTQNGKFRQIISLI